MNKALIVVDVQRDFCEGGALAANDTPSLLDPLQKVIEKARKREIVIVFTQDWHPPDHESFKKNGGEWPVHCEIASQGAELMPPLAAQSDDLIIHKGVARGDDGYSAFESTELADRLRSLGIDEVAICGIATEYCVRATALDAVKAKIKAVLFSDLIRPVDPKAAPAVLQELSNAGVELITSASWLDS